MSEVILGKKIAEKHVNKVSNRLSPFLGFGETIVLIVDAFNKKPLRDTLVVTTKRIICTYKDGSGELEWALDLDQVSRVAFEGSDMFVKTLDGDVLAVARISHLRDDEPLVRSAVSSLTRESIADEGGGVLDPSAKLQTGPRTKPKQVRDAVATIDTFLTDGEEMLFLEIEYNDFYCLTNQRMIHVSRSFKTKAEEQDVSVLVRAEVMKDGIKWLLVGADAQHQLFRLGEFNHEDSARWLASKFEEAYEHFRDPWRDEIRQFIDQVGLGYAFEQILPLLWPRFGDEVLLSAFGGGEDLIIFTSERAVVLPDLVVIPREDWTELIFATGRHEHYAFNGTLLETQIGMSLDSRVRDGRRYAKMQFIGNSQQAFNAAIPAITAALNELTSHGFPVVEGADWLEQTQSPPPPPRQGPTSFVGYSVEF